jgi:hypothetical protein
MGTTAQDTTTVDARDRASGRGPEAEDLREEYDLLIAVGLGVALGVGLTLLMHRGGRRERGAIRLVRAARAGAARAGRAGAEGAEWAARQGEALLDRLPASEIREAIGEYFDAARSAIDDAVARELKGLRKAVRRQRKRLRL